VPRHSRRHGDARRRGRGERETNRVRTLVGRLLPALLVALLAVAFVPAVSADPLDEATRRVARQLMCPVCEGQTVADSNAGLAQDMRAVIRSKLQAGESEQQILDHFVRSYGESILAEPPKHGLGLVAWLGPVLAMGLGAAILGLVATQWARRRQSATTPAAPAILKEGVAEEFRRFREEYQR
jgi:cytochrome c-type biogenesis protein CcmH